MDISSNESHCGGCGEACAGGYTCESVSVTSGCSPAPANTSGRCRCVSTSNCPDGQICRTSTPYNNRCAPSSGTNCASGATFVDVSFCPNYCRY
ncbi:MAG: hypothetical protein ACYC8T_03655 [Myxococcaceae bacterium]